MNILGCLDTPTSGEYFLNGKLVSTLSEDELAYIRNKEIGFVFRSLIFCRGLMPLEMLSYP